MLMNLAAVIGTCMTDDEFIKDYASKVPSDTKFDSEQAEAAFDKWLDGITEYAAHEKAFDIHEHCLRAAKADAFADGLKTGIRFALDVMAQQ